MSFPASLTRAGRVAPAGLFLAALLAGCGGGEQKPILAPTIQASLQYAAPNTDRTVYFANPVVVGDSIQLDVLIQDSGGTLDIDDVDLVLTYDATFLQVTSINAQNTLFGTCNTLNPLCGVNSPICIDNRHQANGGGAHFCRSDGTTPCSTDKDCPASGDACGSFGTLDAAFAVITGPKVCSNLNSQTCMTDSQCGFCLNNNSLACTTSGDCLGTCAAGFCSNIPGRSCLADADCVDTCDVGTCQGCPSVIVAGTQRIATLVLRVMREGTGDFRFVVPSVPGGPGSAVRKDVVDQSVDFYPKVGGGPAEISITGRL